MKRLPTCLFEEEARAPSQVQSPTSPHVVNYSTGLEKQACAVADCVSTAPANMSVNQVTGEPAFSPRFLAEDSDDSSCSPLLVDEQATLAVMSQGLEHPLSNHLLTREPETAVCGSENYAEQRDNIPKHGSGEPTTTSPQVTVRPPTVNRYGELSGFPLIVTMGLSPETPENNEEGAEPCAHDVEPDLLTDSSAKGCTGESLGAPLFVQPAEVAGLLSSAITPPTETDEPGPQFAANRNPIQPFVFGVNLDAYLLPADPPARGLPPLPPEPATRHGSALLEKASPEDLCPGIDSSASSLVASKPVTEAGTDSLPRCGGTKEMGVTPKTAPVVRQITATEKVESGVGGPFSGSLGVKRDNTIKKAPTPPLESFHQVSIKVHLPCQLDQKLLRAVVQMMPQQQELEISSIHFPYTFSVRIPPSILECLCRGGDEGDDKTREDPRRNTGGVTVLRIVVYGHSPQTSATKTTGLVRPWSSSSQEESGTSAAEETGEMKGLKCRRALSRTASPVISKRSTSVSATRSGIPIGYVNVPLKALLARGDSTGHGITWLALTKVDTTKLAPLTPWQLDYYNDSFNRAANTGLEFLRPKVAVSFKLLTPEGTPISTPLFEGRSPLKRLRHMEKELEQIYIQADLEIERHKTALKEEKRNKKGVKAYIRDFDSPEFALLERDCQRLKRELKLSEEGAKTGFATREETIRRLQHDLRTARLLIRSNQRRPKAPDRCFQPGQSGQTTGDEMESQDEDAAQKTVPTVGGPGRTRSSASVSWEIRRLRKRITEQEQAHQETRKQLEETEKQKNSLEAELKAVRDQLNLERSKSKVQRQTIADLHALQPQFREARRRASSTGSESREPKDKEVSSSKRLGDTFPDDHISLSALRGECRAQLGGAQTRQQQLLASRRLSIGQPSNGRAFEGATRRQSVSSLNHRTRLPTPGRHRSFCGAAMLKGLSVEDRDVLKVLTVNVTDNSLPALRSALGVPLAETQTKAHRGVGGHLRSTKSVLTAKDQNDKVPEQLKRPRPEVATVGKSVHAPQSVDQETCEGAVEETRKVEIKVASGVAKVEACVSSGTAYPSVGGLGFTADLLGNAPYSEQTLQETFFAQQNVDVCRSLARVSDSLCYSESNCSPRSFESPTSCQSRGPRGLPGSQLMTGGMVAPPSPILEESDDQTSFSQLAESPRSTRREQDNKRESPISEMLNDAAANKFDRDKSFAALLNGMADAADAAASEAAEAVHRLESGPAEFGSKESSSSEAECGVVRHRSFPGGGVFTKHPSVPRLDLPDSLVSDRERFTPPPYDPFENRPSEASTDGASLSECSGAVPDQDHDLEGHLKSAVEETTHEVEKDFLKEEHSRAPGGLATRCQTRGTSILRGNEPCYLPVAECYRPLAGQYEVGTGVYTHNDVEPSSSCSGNSFEASDAESSSLVTENEASGPGLYSRSLVESGCEDSISGVREPCPSDESDVPLEEPSANSPFRDCAEKFEITSSSGALNAPGVDALASSQSGVLEGQVRVPSPMNDRVHAGSLALPTFPVIVGAEPGNMKNGLSQVSDNKFVEARPVASPQEWATETSSKRIQNVADSAQTGTATNMKPGKPTNFVINNIRSAGIPRNPRLTGPLRHGVERDGHAPLGGRGSSKAAGVTKTKAGAGHNYSPESGGAARAQVSTKPKRVSPAYSLGVAVRSPTKKSFSPQRARGAGPSRCRGEMTRRTVARKVRVNSSSPLKRVGRAARAAAEASCATRCPRQSKKASKCSEDKASSRTPGTVFSDGDCGAVRRRNHLSSSSDESSVKASEDEGLGRCASIHKCPQYLHGRLGLREDSVATADPPSSSVEPLEPLYSSGGHTVVVNTVADAGVEPPAQRCDINCLEQRGGESEVTSNRGFTAHTSPSRVAAPIPTASSRSRPSSPGCPVRAASAGAKWLEDSRGISVATANLARQLRVELDEEFPTIEPYISNPDLTVEGPATLD
ncbi:hypothetical protein CSUI_009332, partial [Cystoisospora suis]